MHLGGCHTRRVRRCNTHRSMEGRPSENFSNAMSTVSERLDDVAAAASSMSYGYSRRSSVAGCSLGNDAKHAAAESRAKLGKCGSRAPYASF